MHVGLNFLERRAAVSWQKNLIENSVKQKLSSHAYQPLMKTAFAIRGAGVSVSQVCPQKLTGNKHRYIIIAISCSYNFAQLFVRYNQVFSFIFQSLKQKITGNIYTGNY
jgi:hypothetical protein